MFEKVRTRKMYAEIVDQILGLVRDGKLQVGDKLPPERVLAEDLGVSRPPLREAISALEILGIIESRGGKGNFIKNSEVLADGLEVLKKLKSQESPFEILEARKVVEVEIAGLAAERASEKDIERISRLLSEHEKVKSDFSVAMSFDMEFHKAIAKTAGNNVLLQFFNYLLSVLKEDLLWKKIKKEAWAKGRNSEKYLDEHKRILAAIRNKEKIKAREAMFEHLNEIGLDFLKEEESNGE